MRILVHYHAYGDATKVPKLVNEHRGRIRTQIDFREEDEVGRLLAEYEPHADKLAKFDANLAAANIPDAPKPQKFEKQREKLAAKTVERDQRIAEARRRSQDDRRDVEQVCAELGALYGDPDELLKHARVVGITEIEENEFNLNIPRYVDTFEPEPRIDVRHALKTLHEAERTAAEAGNALSALLREIGYEAN
jgi:type I restriction enzyme M protein